MFPAQAKVSSREKCTRQGLLAPKLHEPPKLMVFLNLSSWQTVSDPGWGAPGGWVLASFGPLCCGCKASSQLHSEQRRRWGVREDAPPRAALPLILEETHQILQTCWSPRSPRSPGRGPACPGAGVAVAARSSAGPPPGWRGLLDRTGSLNWEDRSRQDAGAGGGAGRSLAAPSKGSQTVGSSSDLAQLGLRARGWIAKR